MLAILLDIAFRLIPAPLHQEVGINPCVKVGGFGPKCENQAVAAQISQMHCGGALNLVEGTYLGWSKLGLKGQEMGIDPHARVGGCGLKTEN